MRVFLPSGFPLSTIDALFFAIHAIISAPSFSPCFFISSGDVVFFHSAIVSTGTRYMTTNFFIWKDYTKSPFLASRKCGGIAFSKMYTFSVIESLRNSLERGPDAIATEEEVEAIFEKLAGDKTFTETRKIGDETGLFLWDVEIQMEDGKAEYSFRRGRVE